MNVAKEVAEAKQELTKLISECYNYEALWIVVGMLERLKELGYFDKENLDG